MPITSQPLKAQFEEIVRSIASQQELAASLCREGRKEKAKAARAKLLGLFYQRDLLLSLMERTFELPGDSTNDNIAAPEASAGNPRRVA